MCGITGILNYDHSHVKKESLLAMNETMLLRGPDDSGFHIDNNCGIAMRRLAIIDLDNGKQPISNASGTIHVVLNGEIYNYLELRTKLQNRGYSFSTQSDTEVLVHLYEEFGTNAVSYLNGMFSFAIWDSSKKRLWIARDRLGIKPLVYFEHSGGFAFASDLRALVKHPSFSKDLDIDSLLLFFNLAYIPQPRTIWAKAKKLPPGHWILIENNHLKIERYWQIKPNLESRINKEQFLSNVEGCFFKSINFRSRSDVPVGTFLSGGLDSSAITALFSKQSSKPIHTFCMDFKDKEFNEGYYASLVSNRYDTIHHSYTLNLDTALDELEELLPLMDEPLGDSAIIPSYILSKLAKQNNISVMLSGAGGDELFGGYRRHYPNKKDFFTEKIPMIPLSLWRLLGKIISKKVMHHGILSMDKGLAYGLNTAGVNLGYFDYLINNSTFFRQSLELSKQQFSNMTLSEKRYGYNYSRMLIDIQNYLVDNILSITDKASMAASVEARVPFLDHNLVEMVFSVPAHANPYLDGFDKSKQLLKEISKNLLPNKILNRPKMGFNAPVNSWMNSKNNIIGERIKNLRHPLLAELFNSKSISNIWSNSTKRQAASESLFMIYIVDKWLEIHG